MGLFFDVNLNVARFHNNHIFFGHNKPLVLHFYCHFPMISSLLLKPPLLLLVLPLQPLPPLLQLRTQPLPLI